jgi:acetolactate synthase-1/2/3 large subunit
VDWIVNLLKKIPDEVVLTCDVGNNEFWCAQAYVMAEKKNRVLYSKAYGALGNSVAKAIGAYYASAKPVLCFTGDQGLQLNIQELQFIAQHQLPIHICVINNRASGMIRDREQLKYNAEYVHTTLDTGYGVPDLEMVVKAYGLNYGLWNPESEEFPAAPCLIEMRVEEEVALRPSLPMGKDCQDMSPELPRELYAELNRI